MGRGHRELGTLLVSIVVVVVAACGGSSPVTQPSPRATGASTIPTPSPTEAPPVGVTDTAAPTPTAPPVPTATPEPTDAPEPTDTPEPTNPPLAPVIAPGWTTQRVGAVAECAQLSAGIDVASRDHVAAECGGNIYYFVSNADHTWSQTVFPHPSNRQDFDPQIAFRGNLVYVAYSRIAPDGGCGGYRGVDVGVYFRTRTLPDGAWSDPVRIGPLGDHVESFRVDGDTIHATVHSGEGGTAYYETLKGSTYHRYRIPNASGATSLRVGSDGRARIAYETGAGIRYAVSTGSGFATKPIRGTSRGDRAPILVLDANNRAHVLWTRTQAATCGDSPVGTYYATNVHGTWTAQRITKDTGETSLQIDEKTGRLHALVNGNAGLRYSTAAPDGAWTGLTVASHPSAMAPLLRLDPATGALFIVYIDASDFDSTEIVALTKP